MASRKAWRKSAVEAAEPACRTPISGFACSCPRTVRGHAAAPPTPAINARRPIPWIVIEPPRREAELEHINEARQFPGRPRNVKAGVGMLAHCARIGREMHEGAWAPPTRPGRLIQWGTLLPCSKPTGAAHD